MLADESLRGRDMGRTMQRHEVQLELRALLEERHHAKIARGEATRVGRGLERVYFSKLITGRDPNEAL